MKRSASPEKTNPIILSGVILLLIFPPSIQYTNAQQYIDLVRVNYNSTSLNTYKDSDITTSITEFDLDATLPIVMNNKTTFITGIIGEAFRVKPDVGESSKNIFSISTKIGLNVSHGEKWSGSYILLPKIATDFEHISRKDFQIGGIVLFKYNKSVNLNYKIGMYANTELFGPWFVPLLGLYYLSDSKKFEMNLTLPFLADINYKLNKALTVGVNFNGITKSYHLNLSQLNDAPGYLVRATNELYVYGSTHLSKNIIFQVKAGHSFGRYYRVYAEDDQVSMGMPLVFFNDDRTQLNSDFEDGWVFQIMAFYRLPLVAK